MSNGFEKGSSHKHFDRLDRIDFKSTWLQEDVVLRNTSIFYSNDYLLSAGIPMAGVSDKKRTLLILFLVGLLVGVGFYLAPLKETRWGPDDSQNDADSVAIQKDMDHAIEVRSNRELELISRSGSGTADNPFIIENLTIGLSSPRIDIRHVNVHFIIRNVFLPSSTPSSMYGIYFEEVAFGTIESCRIDLYATYSIGLYKSNSCTVHNNTITGSQYQSMLIYNSTNIFVSGNKFLEHRIELGFVKNCTINDNVIIDAGLSLGNGMNCSLVNNTFTREGITVDGDLVGYFDHIISNNTIDGRPIGYFNNVSDISLNLEGYSMVVLANSTNTILMNGHFLDVTTGVFIAFCTNSRAIGNVIRDSEYGISVHRSDSISVTNNTIYNITNFPIHLYGSHRCVAEGNSIERIDTWNINQGVRVQSSTECRIENNVIHGTETPIFTVYSVGCIVHNNTIYRGHGPGVFIYRSTNITVIQNTVYESREGVHVLASDSCSIFHNHLINNTSSGIGVYHADYLHIYDNTIDGNGHNGISLDLSMNSTLLGNNVTNNMRNGALISHSKGTAILENSFSYNNHSGLFLHNSEDCDIRGNDIVFNRRYGIRIDSECSFNIIVLNRIGWNNISNAIDDGTTNSWDNGTLGNHWSDYNGTGVYVIPGTAGAVDRYPSPLLEALSLITNEQMANVRNSLRVQELE
ncbi:MAG: right-handed parallel beta-helix repeat-containing protein [Candidatus Thorarchaeota archaeon]|nr:MAG: right-handed parallel beta-helix repeat-containing protein [Candidatus Thorarchaeota archaeon]